MQPKSQARDEINPSANGVASGAAPRLHEHASETQNYEQLVKWSVALALTEEACTSSVGFLNQMLADTLTLRDLYKKHHWQVLGPTFTLLYLLYEKHYAEQEALVDVIAERIQLLGGVTVAMGADVAEKTIIPQPPREREEVPAQLSRLLKAHELIILATRRFAAKANDLGDVDTHDMLVGNVQRINELQAWFLSERLRRHDVAAVPSSTQRPGSVRRGEPQATDQSAKSRSEEQFNALNNIAGDSIKSKGSQIATAERGMERDSEAGDRRGSRFSSLFKRLSEVFFWGAVLSLAIAATLCLFSVRTVNRIDEDVVLYTVLVLSLAGIAMAALSAILGSLWRGAPASPSMKSAYWTT